MLSLPLLKQILYKKLPPKKQNKNNIVLQHTVALCIPILAPLLHHLCATSSIY
jgi:hypothetical protein